jgi:transcriptional regulator with XRE-family HTH domain
LTQIQFAEPLSISGSYVSNLEKGEATPSEAVVREIVSYYNINRTWLETGEGNMFRVIGIADLPAHRSQKASDLMPDLDAMTLEQKLDWCGLSTKDKRYLLELHKLSEEEQEALLKQLAVQNIEKGRY